MLSSDGMRIWLHPWLLSSLLHTYIYTYQHTYHWCLDIAPTQRKDFSNSREKKEKKKDGCEKLKNDYLSRLRIYISVYIYICVHLWGFREKLAQKRETINSTFWSNFFLKKRPTKARPPRLEESHMRMVHMAVLQDHLKSIEELCLWWHKWQILTMQCWTHDGFSPKN